MTEANISDEEESDIEDLGEFSKYLANKPKKPLAAAINMNRNINKNRSSMLTNSQDSSINDSAVKQSLSSLKERLDRAEQNRFQQ